MKPKKRHGKDDESADDDFPGADGSNEDEDSEVELDSMDGLDGRRDTIQKGRRTSHSKSKKALASIAKEQQSSARDAKQQGSITKVSITKVSLVKRPMTKQSMTKKSMTNKSMSKQSMPMQSFDDSSQSKRAVNTPKAKKNQQHPHITSSQLAAELELEQASRSSEKNKSLQQNANRKSQQLPRIQTSNSSSGSVVISPQPPDNLLNLPIPSNTNRQSNTLPTRKRKEAGMASRANPASTQSSPPNNSNQNLPSRPLTIIPTKHRRDNASPFQQRGLSQDQDSMDQHPTAQVGIQTSEALFSQYLPTGAMENQVVNQMELLTAKDTADTSAEPAIHNT